MESLMERVVPFIRMGIFTRATTSRASDRATASTPLLMARSMKANGCRISSMGVAPIISRTTTSTWAFGIVISSRIMA